jgi:hypothetical protein
MILGGTKLLSGTGYPYLPDRLSPEDQVIILMIDLSKPRSVSVAWPRANSYLRARLPSQGELQSCHVALYPWHHSSRLPAETGFGATMQIRTRGGS